MKNLLKTFDSRFEHTEDRVSKLDNWSIEIIHPEKQKEKNKE